MVEVVEAEKAPSVASPPQELLSIRPPLMASASADPSGSPQDMSQWMTVTEDSWCGPPPRPHNFAFVFAASRVSTVLDAVGPSGRSGGPNKGVLSWTSRKEGARAPGTLMGRGRPLGGNSHGLD